MLPENQSDQWLALDDERSRGKTVSCGVKNKL